MDYQKKIYTLTVEAGSPGVVWKHGRVLAGLQMAIFWLTAGYLLTESYHSRESSGIFLSLYKGTHSIKSGFSFLISFNLNHLLKSFITINIAAKGLFWMASRKGGFCDLSGYPRSMYCKPVGNKERVA